MVCVPCWRYTYQCKCIVLMNSHVQFFMPENSLLQSTPLDVFVLQLKVWRISPTAIKVLTVYCGRRTNTSK